MTKNLTFNEIQELLYKEYKKNGYEKMWNRASLNHHLNIFEPIFDIAELGLINTEVSEAIETIRIFDNKEMGIDSLHFSLGVECADIIIRTLNFMKRKGLDTEYFILVAHNKNLKRGKLHGKRV